MITPAEPQVLFNPFGSSIVRPAGSVSVNASAESLLVGLELAIVIPRAVDVESPTPISVGAKALVIVGGGRGVTASAGPAATSAAPPTAVSAARAATRRRR